MSIVVLVVGLLLAFLAFRFITGIVKFAVIAAIVIAVIYFLSQGSL